MCCSFLPSLLLPALLHWTLPHWRRLVEHAAGEQLHHGRRRARQVRGGFAAGDWGASSATTRGLSPLLPPPSSSCACSFPYHCSHQEIGRPNWDSTGERAICAVGSSFSQASVLFWFVSWRLLLLPWFTKFERAMKLYGLGSELGFAVVVFGPVFGHAVSWMRQNSAQDSYWWKPVKGKVKPKFEQCGSHA